MANFFARMLVELCPGDPFAERANPYQTPKEVTKLLGETPWDPATPESARTFGQLITAACSLVHGLYNDVVTDLGWDTYGPFEVLREGKKLAYLIRDFPNLAPAELWPAEVLAPVGSLTFHSLYEDVNWEIRGVGCHTVVTKGSAVAGMRHAAVLADGKKLPLNAWSGLIAELVMRAEEIYRRIRSLSFEELKAKVQLQECYQLKKLFDAAGVDWRPTGEMQQRMVGKPLATGVVPHGKMITDLEEYQQLFGINQFAREVLENA